MPGAPEPKRVVEGRPGCPRGPEPPMKLILQAAQCEDSLNERPGLAEAAEPLLVDLGDQRGLIEPRESAVDGQAKVAVVAPEHEGVGRRS